MKQNKMAIQKHYKVPTGDIIIVNGERNRMLETVSVADYGIEKNVKADFLGLSRELNGVPNGEMMPLTKKWVITISSQYGCSMGCKFCDVPKVGHGINASQKDLLGQVKQAMSLHPEIEGTDKLNIHLARMGEPTFNGAVLDFAATLRRNIYSFWDNCKSVHPVISTMLPKKNPKLESFLQIWCDDIKNKLYDGDAGLQFSINSTSDEERDDMFNGSSLSLDEISKIGHSLPMPKGRKYTLNFALMDNVEVDAVKLRKWFDPEKFIVKITPMHNTNSCVDNEIETTDGYEYFTPYKETEEALKEQGFDVIVFVPSQEEESGRITCGNAILSGSKPEIDGNR